LLPPSVSCHASRSSSARWRVHTQRRRVHKAAQHAPPAPPGRIHLDAAHHDAHVRAARARRGQQVHARAHPVAEPAVLRTRSSVAITTWRRAQLRPRCWCGARCTAAATASPAATGGGKLRQDEHRVRRAWGGGGRGLGQATQRCGCACALVQGGCNRCSTCAVSHPLRPAASAAALLSALTPTHTRTPAHMHAHTCTLARTHQHTHPPTHTHTTHTTHNTQPAGPALSQPCAHQRRAHGLAHGPAGHARAGRAARARRGPDHLEAQPAEGVRRSAGARPLSGEVAGLLQSCGVCRQRSGSRTSMLLLLGAWRLAVWPADAVAA
jgi:hypothetical protein